MTDRWFGTRSPACQIGSNRCHGCASWCDDCGDVGDSCDSWPNCDAHTCTTCGRKALIRDYECEACHERAAEQARCDHLDREVRRAENLMLVASELGLTDEALRWSREMARQLGRPEPLEWKP